jgi:hypothetical protein
MRKLLASPTTTPSDYDESLWTLMDTFGLAVGIEHIIVDDIRKNINGICRRNVESTPWVYEYKSN